MRNPILSFFLLLTLAFSGCNSDDDDKDFKSLARDKDFKNAHESPLDIGKLPLSGTMVTFKTSKGPDGKAYLVKSRRATKKWLFVFHEWWGLNGYIQKESDRLANELVNVNVLALDLYDGKIAKDADQASKLVNETSDARIEDIINGAINYVGDSSMFATIGWCFGGGWSLQTAIMAGGRDIGCVMYYGMPEKNMSKIEKIDCPVLGIFADRDKGITKEIVADFASRMQVAAKPMTLKTFDADHAFANPSNPHYNKQAAQEANTISLFFLKGRFSEVPD